jgi:phage protein D
MAEKVKKLGIARNNDFMLYVKDGNVWQVRRKQPGVPKGRPEMVAEGGFQMDNNYIYFVDKDGDVSRAKRAVGGQKRKKAPKKVKKAKKAKKPAKKPAKKAKKAKKPAKKGRR